MRDPVRSVQWQSHAAITTEIMTAKLNDVDPQADWQMCSHGSLTRRRAVFLSFCPGTAEVCGTKSMRSCAAVTLLTPQYKWSLSDIGR